jgi:hypothetical protein
VKPEDVTANNTNDITARLAAELKADAKSPTNGPITAEVSYIKGGIK